MLLQMSAAGAPLPRAPVARTTRQRCAFACETASLSLPGALDCILLLRPHLAIACLYSAARRSCLLPIHPSERKPAALPACQRTAAPSMPARVCAAAVDVHALRPYSRLAQLCSPSIPARMPATATCIMRHPLRVPQSAPPPADGGTFYACVWVAVRRKRQRREPARSAGPWAVTRCVHPRATQR
jgi:hypothetical protein